jgi:D-alanyl-lipoteichoic acid acyltransferase DltB (MBOAT superfamily)
VGFWLIQGRQLQAALWYLTVASGVFYAYWNPRDLIIAAASVIANYFVAKALLSREERPRWLFVGAIAANLLVLGYYKYLAFLLGLFSFELGSAHNVSLPLGISFFTFTQIAYLADCWAGKIRPEQHVPRDYFLFVSFFPHLIAGPILHHSDVFSQFRGGFRDDRATKIATGVVLFSIGLFKKVIIADNLSLIVKPVFSSADGGVLVNSGQAWAGALAYALQLYFDFSGYSDMAVASALLIGFKIPFNFDSPYRATSIIEFWRRWHMTLSRFLRDYLYIPLGGNQKGERRRFLNIFTTMLLGGIWHGAGVNFIIWGALHGFFIVVNHFWRDYVVAAKPVLGRSRYIALPAYVLTMACVLLGWVFFRSETVSGAFMLTRRLFWIPDMAFEGNPVTTSELSLILAACLIATTLPNSRQAHDLLLSGQLAGHWRTMGTAAGVLFAIAFVAISPDSPFLYFQF